MIHLYTGDGKGKTTAAFGLALRSLGRGRQVVIVQFLKGRDTGEASSLAVLPGLTLLRNGKDYGFYTQMTVAEKVAITGEHNHNLRQALSILAAGNCDLLILDEVVAAYNHGLLDTEVIDNLLITAAQGTPELVLTGRNAPQSFIQSSDYLTEMKKIKHPYDQGVNAREGVEY